MVGITVDATRALKRLGRVKGDVKRSLAAAVLRAAHTAASVISRVVMENHAGGTSQLARSFLANVGFVQKTPSQVSARTFSPLPYAGVQDRGGDILPRTVKNLAIPLTPEAKKKWPRDWAQDDLFAIVLRGKKFLVEKVGKGLIFHYVLKDKVTLKGSGYRDKAAKQARPLVDRVIREALDQAVRR